MRRTLLRFLHETSGVAVIEFALIGPTLLFMLLAAIDIGNVLSEREAMEHVLRSGAQMAMGDLGSDAVLAAMQGAASDRFTLTAGTKKSVALAASRFCACPSSPATSTGCSTICTGSLPTNIYYRMTATKTYNGIVFPLFNLTPAMQVQVR